MAVEPVGKAAPLFPSSEPGRSTVFAEPPPRVFIPAATASWKARRRLLYSDAGVVAHAGGHLIPRDQKWE